MSKFRRMLAMCLLLLVIATAVLLGGDYLRNYSVPFNIMFVSPESDVFRQQHISDDNLAVIKAFSETYDVSLISLIAATMAANKFDLGGNELENFTQTQWELLEKYLQKHYRQEYEDLQVAYGKIWSDIKYFPVAASKTNADATVSFEDSWMYERTYGGKRGHEGTDLMAKINERGYYPVISMTDGVVEKIGWLEKGGYRIGIRGVSGGYYYYAHLYQYAEDFQVGDTVSAGELIAYMGDSGYGEEGTVGQFAVHLHVGIYFNGEDGQEVSVNPYPVMRYFEEKTLQYDY